MRTWISGQNACFKIDVEPAKATSSVISPLFGFQDVRMDVCNELISETAPTIFLKLGMKFMPHEVPKNGQNHKENKHETKLDWRI